MKKNKSTKVILKVIFAFGVLFLAFYSGYGYGSKYGRIKNAPDYLSNTKGDDETVDFGLFWHTWNKARELYVGKSDPNEMLYGAISGMVSSLGDPYTVFLKPQDNEDLMTDLAGKFEGIGAELTEESGFIVVISPLSGSPAEKAGIKPRDIVLEIDGQSTENMSIDSAVKKIRGKAGTEVKIKVKHAAQENANTVTIVRASIKVDSATYDLKKISGKNIAVFKISQFGDDTVDLTRQFVERAKTDAANGIILDLRNNPGGYLDSSVDFASFFIAKDSVVLKEVDKNNQVTEYKTKNDVQIGSAPIVILVNGGSASAAEIVAGALQDNKRAMIIGEKTFGKGSVQQLEPLAGGASLKVTIAKWLTPSGREIDRTGLTPDIVVSFSEKDKTSGNDAQMIRAESEIISKLK